MRRKLIKNYNKIIAFILSILGVGGTTFSCAMYGIPAEYGTPYANFKINGTVTKHKNEKLPGIKVKMPYDSTLTNAYGKYEIETQDIPTGQTFEIQFIDIDGPENGEFETLDTVVVFENPKFENGDGDWFQGNTSREFNIKLTDKTE